MLHCYFEHSDQFHVRRQSEAAEFLMCVATNVDENGEARKSSIYGIQTTYYICCLVCQYGIVSDRESVSRMGVVTRSGDKCLPIRRHDSRLGYGIPSSPFAQLHASKCENFVHSSRTHLCFLPIHRSKKKIHRRVFGLYEILV